MAPRLADITATQLQQHQTADLMRALSARAFGGSDPAGYFADRWPRVSTRISS